MVPCPRRDLIASIAVSVLVARPAQGLRLRGLNQEESEAALLTGALVGQFLARYAWPRFYDKLWWVRLEALGKTIVLESSD